MTYYKPHFLVKLFLAVEGADPDRDLTLEDIVYILKQVEDQPNKYMTYTLGKGVKDEN
jgi:hypothetical protein